MRTVFFVGQASLALAALTLITTACVGQRAAHAGDSADDPLIVESPVTEAPGASDAAPTELLCTSTAGELPGDAGTAHTVVCPAGCEPASVWGSGPYTEDSSVCSAAVHAGAITAASGGTVEVVIGAGADRYEASERHGISAKGWGRLDRSFTVRTP